KSDPKFAAFETALAERKRQENARFLAGALALAKQQKAFLVSEIARDVSSPSATAFLARVKLLDAALASADLKDLVDVTGETDRLVRESGLRDRFLLASTSTAPSAIASGPQPAEPAPGGPVDLASATTAKNRFLIEGALGDFVVLFNTTAAAPN